MAPNSREIPGHTACVLPNFTPVGHDHQYDQGGTKVIELSGAQWGAGDLTSAGKEARWRFLEFFTANIRNKDTRLAYLRVVLPSLAWCEARGPRNLPDIKPIMVPVRIEQHPVAPSTVKQHLALIRVFWIGG